MSSGGPSGGPRILSTLSLPRRRGRRSCATCAVLFPTSTRWRVGNLLQLPADPQRLRGWGKQLRPLLVPRVIARPRHPGSPVRVTTASLDFMNTWVECVTHARPVALGCQQGAVVIVRARLPLTSLVRSPRTLLMCKHMRLPMPMGASNPDSEGRHAQFSIC